MRLHILYSGLADDFPREALARTGGAFDPDDLVSIPTLCYLIEHESGLIVYDTGWSLRRFQKFHLPAEMRIVNTLAAHGVKPADVDHLILSHLHLDHAGDIEPFVNAKVYVSKKEFEGVSSLLLQNKLAGTAYVEEDIRAWTHGDIDWQLIDSEYEILDFLPGIKLVSLGRGHAFGILAMLIELPSYGPVLICSDAIYASVNAGPPLIPPGVIMDEEGWRRSAGFLMDIAKERGAELWYGHDLEQATQLLADGGMFE